MIFVVEFFSEPFWYRLGLTLTHFLWQGALLAILVGTVGGLLRIKRGNSRYAAYLTAFIVMTACPIVTFIILEAPADSAITPAEAIDATPARLIAEKVLTAHHISPETDGTTQSETNKIASIDSLNVHRKISDYTHRFIPYALTVWSIGVIALSVRLLLGLIGVCRWRRNLEPLPVTLVGRISSLCERLGMAGFSRMFVSTSVIQAMAVGYLRPMILLPAALVAQMQPEMLEAVIAHELAHIRRFDMWVNLFQRVVEILLFFHPAVWWLSNRLQTERELCCDELAVKATGEPLIYATALETATMATFALRRPALVAGFGSRNKPTLSRVRHVLGLAPTRPGVRFWLAGIVTITFLLALAVPFVLIRHAQTNGSADVSTLANIADRFEVKFDRAKWATVSTSGRAAPGGLEQTNDRLQLYTDVNILDPDRVLGISLQGTITQFETSAGEIIDVNDKVSRRSVSPYMPPRYRRRLVMPPKPPRWKTAIWSFLRLPPPKRSRPKPVFELDKNHVRLEIDSGLIESKTDEISHVKGDFWVVAAESLDHVDIPFKPSKEWIRLTDDLEVRVLEAKSDNSRYEYRIETRKTADTFGMGLLRPGTALPDRLATNQLLIGADGKPIQHSRPGFLRSSVGGSGRGGGSNLEIIQKIRFVIAVNPAHCKVPFELENIPVPGRETAGNDVSKPTSSRRPRTANPSRSAFNPDDGTTLRNKWTNLSWKASSDALSYNVYLGDCFEDVNNGVADTFRGNRKGTQLIVGFRGFPYPQGLVPGTTYYWRIDEVSKADPNNPRKGDIRNFSVLPRKASNPVPADGADSVSPNVELSWTVGLDAKLHWVHFGNDHDAVANATGGRPQPKSIFTPPALVPGITYYWRIDEFDPGNGTFKGDVWSFTVKGGAE